jgi:hypothetical protein
MISDSAITPHPNAGYAAASAPVPKVRLRTVLRKLGLVGQSNDSQLETKFRPVRSQTAVSEPGVFGIIVVLYLLPIWLFAYVPTQDGPAHLANAQILKRLATAQARYPQFFEIRWEPFPNWTTHLALAGLLYLFPPLLAHKALACLYVIGFAFSFRYSLAPFGRNTLMLAPAGLLFVYNRCSIQYGIGTLGVVGQYWLDRMGFWRSRLFRPAIPKGAASKCKGG